VQPAPVRPAPVQPPPVQLPPVQQPRVQPPAAPQPTTPPPSVPVVTARPAQAPPPAGGGGISIIVGPPVSAASLGGASPAGSPAASSRSARRDRPAARNARTRTGAAVVRVEFSLAKARRLFLIVRGPAPSCETAAVLPFRGRKGFNSVPFAGRLRGEQLEPGVYGLSVSRTRAVEPDARAVHVRVVSQRRTVLVPEERAPSCNTAAAVRAERYARLLAPVAAASDGSNPPASAGGVAGRAPSAPLLPPTLPGDEGEVVLAGLPTPPPALGTGDDDGGNLEAVASLGVLVAIGFLLVMMLALVTRFLRGTWNP
jgi:hypothetical protein